MANLDLYSWLTGFALGLCGKPLPFVKKTPIGYSYNGTVLPGNRMTIPMDKTSMTLGWLVGRRIAGQRVSKKPPYKKGSLRCSTIDLTTATNKGGDTWEPITWKGSDMFVGDSVWTDGTNIYADNSQNAPIVLNGDTWEAKTWQGFDGLFYGDCVWTDGTNIYYSRNAFSASGQYVLNGSAWEAKEWGNHNPNGGMVWTDGANIFTSGVPTKYILSGDTWEQSALGAYPGSCVWSDGANIYLSDGTRQFVRNGGTWETKTWQGLTEFSGHHVWSDGTNIYYSGGEEQYVLNGDTWEVKMWNGLTSFFAAELWTDGNYIYRSTFNSYEGIHYVLTNHNHTNE